jgi:hypothetical protein
MLTEIKRPFVNWKYKTKFNDEWNVPSGIAKKHQAQIR